MVLSLVSQIPSPVYAETTASGTRIFDDAGDGYDYAIGGLPFNSAAGRDRPVVRRTAEVRKDQSDTSREPGEHSLAFWWLRSQSSFHGGAGQRYLGSADTETDDISRYRFWDSEGVDVFSEPGSVKLLPDAYRLINSPGVTPLIAVTDSGTLYVALGNGLTKRDMAPVGIQPDLPSSSMDYFSTTVSWGGTDPILSLATDGTSYFVATENGIWRGTGSGAATKIYTLSAGAEPLLRYVKQRLILGLNQYTAPSAVYELDPAAAAATPLPTPVFTATRAWRWTDIAETPTAILISGHNFGRSAVYRLSLDSTGAVPVLAPGVVTVEMPPGELITGMSTYLGTVIGVQTTKGFRVGVLQDSGDFTYGPLLFEHAWNTKNTAVFGYGNSLYAGYTNAKGVAGLARVDLTNTIGSGQSLRFPYAPDRRAATGGIFASGDVSQAMLWDYERFVFVVPNVGVFVNLYTKVSTGWLQTSRIRWDTLEPKLMRYARLRGDGEAGTIGLEVGRDSDTVLSTVTTVDLSQRDDSGDVYVTLEPGQFFTARLTLSGQANLSGYQFKAMPAQRRQRLITLPLACYDRETSNTGQVLGQGTAMSRLLALEELEQSSEVVTLQWLSIYPEEQLTEYVVVEGIEFNQTAVASDAYGWGGVIALTLRTVG